MNDIIGIFPEFKLTWYQALIALVIAIFWTRFVMNLVLRLAERVGLIMTSGDMPSPVSTGINDEVNLFTPNPCIKCGHKQGWKIFIPFTKFFVNHNKDCELSENKNQIRIKLTEIVFLIMSVSLVSFLYWSDSYMSPMVLVAYFIAIPLSLFDINFHWIPDRFSISFLLIGLLLSPFASVEHRIFGACLFAALMTFAFIVSGIIRKRDVSSSGDVIMMAGIGAWIGTSNIIPFGVGVIVIYGLMAIEHMITAEPSEDDEISSAMPLGPAIMGGSIIAMLSAVL